MKEWPIYYNMGDHTEGVTVTFDPTQLPYDALLSFFFAQHDPYNNCTDQGQYMSGVWWHNDAQREAIETKITELEASKGSERKVKTYVAQLTTNVYRAEEYHQQFYAKNSNEGYGF